MFGPVEQRDGNDIVEWAARQPWSSGKVGLHGASYGGINQLFTAASRPPALRAIFPVVPMADPYREIIGTGGQINTSFAPLFLIGTTALGLLPLLLLRRWRHTPAIMEPA